jgi:catalase
VSEARISEQLIDSLNQTYGTHRGQRAAHAKGVLCAATFRPTREAAGLSRAPQFGGGPVRGHVRFSNGSGDPGAPDGTRDGRGLALKLYVGGATTDVIGLSLPSFFARTPEDLLAFNQARRPDPETGAVDVERVGAYLAAHPEAVAAVTAAISHPIPASYAAITFNSIHAYGFVNGEGTTVYGRYQFVPAATDDPLSDEEAAGRPPDYLRAELEARLAQGPVRFGLDVIVAGAGDDVDDPSVAWPDDRSRVRVADLDITALAFDRERDGDILVFDPTRVLDGVTLTDDAILRARPGAYSVSVARRTGTPVSTPAAP